MPSIVLGRRLLLVLLFLLGPAPAGAAVEISFYSREWGERFPHAFVRITGSVDATGETVDANFGFTAKRVSPAVLMGAVEGEVIAVDAKYVARSDRHFSLKLSDQEYRSVLALIDGYRTLPQPSYHLNRRNCVFFVADVAAALGLEASPVRKLMKKPRSFLQKVKADNLVLLARRGAAGLQASRR